ncbi:MAG TPA: hypothetical protein VJ063_20960 [Verrucomicrobiae bacterium]|nr:hypothetical protein [Verrucomicrobiae bacterium]
MKQINVSGPFGTIKSKMLKSLADDGGSLNLSEYGNYYAQLRRITAALEGDVCPLLRAILTQDLRCETIDEVSGEGSIWWDFTYKGVRFTVQLLVPSCGGSILYPRSCTRSSAEERELLEEVADKIAAYAKLRQKGNLQRSNAAYRLEIRMARWCCAYMLLAGVLWFVDSWIYHDNLFLGGAIAFAGFAGVFALVSLSAGLIRKWYGSRSGGR